MEDERDLWRALYQPLSEEPHIFAPMGEGQLRKIACALADSAIIVAEYFNMPGAEIARPADPGVIRKVPFRGKGTDKHDTRNRVHSVVQNSIEVRAWNREVCGVF